MPTCCEVKCRRTKKVMKNRVVLITGASSGIGYAIAEALARHKDNTIIMSGKNEKKLTKLTKELAANSPADIDSIVMDVTKTDQVTYAIEQVLKKYGTIDVLIMSAGVSIHGYFGELLVRDYDEVIDTNLKGRFLVAKAAWPIMSKNRGGVIVNISSASGLSNYSTGSIYSASSAGVNSLMDSMALEGQEIGIKVANVVLGQVDTPIWNPNDELVNSSRKGMLSPDGVASYVEFILSRPANEHYRTTVLHPFAIQPLLRGRNRGPGGKFPRTGGDIDELEGGQNFRI